jgi:hypothetical protein
VTDPATGQPYFIPGFAFGVTVNIGGWGSAFRGGGGGDHEFLSANPNADALPKRLWGPQKGNLQDPERPKKIPTVIVVAKKDEYGTCVWREWGIFNENVEKIKRAAAKEADMWRIRWSIWQSLGELLKPGGIREPSSTDIVAQSVADGGGEGAIRRGEEERIEKGTIDAAKARDKAIEKNCNPLKK